MELILISIFTTIIIFMTVYSLIKVLNIAYKRGEISLRNCRLLVTSSIVIGLFVGSTLPFVYQKMFDALF
jgi:hypothetical protein